MFLLIMLAAVPALQGVVEEKQQRIVEVLLGCLSPFELMAGKLLGIVLVSLTTSTVYLAASFYVASRYGVLSLLTPSLVCWFVTFVVLAVLVYGSLFMAIGAAASDLKDTQSLQTAIMMLLALPLMLAGAILRDPSGNLAVAASFFPFTAPMIMVARLASPASVPVWHAPLATFGATLTAFICVWAAGRIFRVGLLLQGTRPRLADLARWVIRG
jgi:ABC-2 type transport system permease protein